jgi:hypothetical protein
MSRAVPSTRETMGFGPSVACDSIIAGLGNWFAKGRDCESCSLQRSHVGFKGLRPTSEMHPQAIAFFHAFEALPAEISAFENEGDVRLRAGEARHPRSQSTATPVASAFPPSTIDRPIVPPMSSSSHSLVALRSLWIAGSVAQRSDGRGSHLNGAAVRVQSGLFVVCRATISHLPSIFPRMSVNRQSMRNRVPL